MVPVGAIGEYPDKVIAPIATELIDAFADRGECELVGESADAVLTYEEAAVEHRR